MSSSKSISRVLMGVVLVFACSGLLLTQGGPPAQPAPAAPASLITGVGNFSHIVSSIEKSYAFYHDALGMEAVGTIGAFQGDPAIMKLGNTVGAQSRYIALKSPSGLGVELIEYKDIARTPAQPHFYDPGAANLQARVRDFDGTLAKLKAAGGRVISAGGVPATIGSGLKAVFLQDPDGFVVELSGAPANAAGTGNVVSTGFEVTIDNTEKTVAFYHDLLGYNLTASTAAFNPDKVMNETAGAPGASFKQSRAPIPGTMLQTTFIEFKDIARNPLHTRVQDPGTSILQLNVKDMDALLKTLKAAGYPAVSPDGQPVIIGGATRYALVRDPNNIYLEFIQRGQ